MGTALTEVAAVKRPDTAHQVCACSTALAAVGCGCTGAGVSGSCAKTTCTANSLEQQQQQQQLARSDSAREHQDPGGPAMRKNSNSMAPPTPGSAAEPCDHTSGNDSNSSNTERSDSAFDRELQQAGSQHAAAAPAMAAAGLSPKPADAAPSLQQPPATHRARRPVARRPSRIIMSSTAADGSPDGPRQVFISMPKPAPELRVRSDNTAGGRRPPERRASVMGIPAYLRSCSAQARLVSGRSLGAIEAAAVAGLALDAAGGVDDDDDDDEEEQRQRSSHRAEQLPSVPSEPDAVGPLTGAPAPWNGSAFAAAAAVSAAENDEAADAAAEQGPPLILLGDAEADPTPQQAAAAAAAADNEDADTVSACSEEWWCGPPSGLRVRDVVSSPAHFVAADADASTAHALMAQHATAVLLVDRGAGLQPGMVEERDLFKLPALLRRRGGRRHGAAVTVGELMRQPVVVVEAGDAIEGAAQALQEADVRRAVVRDAGAGSEAGGWHAQWIGTISEAVIYR